MLVSDISEHMRSTRLNILENKLVSLKCSLIQFFLVMNTFIMIPLLLFFILKVVNAMMKMINK